MGIRDKELWYSLKKKLVGSNLKLAEFIINGLCTYEDPSMILECSLFSFTVTNTCKAFASKTRMWPCSRWTIWWVFLPFNHRSILFYRTENFIWWWWWYRRFCWHTFAIFTDAWKNVSMQEKLCTVNQVADNSQLGSVGTQDMCLLIEKCTSDHHSWFCF